MLQKDKKWFEPYEQQRKREIFHLPGCRSLLLVVALVGALLLLLLLLVLDLVDERGIHERDHVPVK
jgi:hypothetical protein